jgi:hypothetical protein
VSHLAREIGVSRPLLHLHLSAPVLAEAAKTLTRPEPERGSARRSSPDVRCRDNLARGHHPPGVLLAALCLIGVAVTGFLELRKTKLLAAREDHLRQLVGRYEQLAETTLDAQQRVAADVSELRSRTTSIEQILRTVEQ